jgi:hypothetical protein
MGDGLEVLGEHVLMVQGCFRRVRRWVRGRHPHLGLLHFGLSGEWETVIETEVICPQVVFGCENPPADDR